MRVKICGVTRKSDIREAVIAGASYIGLNFFAKSPRFVDTHKARELALEAPIGVIKVALFVDPDDAFLDDVLATVPIDMIQLHGQESPERVRDVRANFGLPVMKAVGIAEQADIDALARFDAADQLLLDAKPPKDATLPGGNGITFDWSLLKNLNFDKPWMLAGGLTPENVREAVEKTGARQVDVSSGVESAPAIKDKRLMESFIFEARQSHEQAQ